MRGPRRETPLLAAASAGRLAAVDLLLARGAKPGARNEAGYTAREMAERLGHAEIVEHLDSASSTLGRLLGN